MFRTKSITIRDFPEQSKAILELSRAHDAAPTSTADQHDHGTPGSSRLRRVLERLLERPDSTTDDESALEQAVKNLLQDIQRPGGAPTATPTPGAGGFEKQHDIFVVGDQPIYVHEGEAMLHEAAEHIAVTELSFSRQDVLVYESDVPFAVDVRPVGGDADTPRNPFYRDDLPFVSRFDAEDQVFRVVAGCIRLAAVRHQRYKATIYLDGRRTVDPDIDCSP